MIRNTTSRFSNEQILTLLTLVLGIFSYVVILLHHNIADGDMWARLVAGACAFHGGSVAEVDFLAYTPVLPEWIDHEWGAGLAFYSLTTWFGSGSLMMLKVLMALGTIAIALFYGFRRICHWPTIILLAILSALTILPGFVPVVRSHVFTYFFFAADIFLLDKARSGHKWPMIAGPVVMLVWANVHGGFVAGLGVMGLFAVYSMLLRQHPRTMIITVMLSFLATFINPYGLKYWIYLVPALLQKRPDITEWHPMPLWENDLFMGFRILCILAIIVILLGWKTDGKKRDWMGLFLMALTAYLGWRHRRHAPFFGIACMMFLAPFITGTVRRFAPAARSSSVPAVCIFVLMASLTALTAGFVLPGASLQVLAPVGFYPVREVDILQQAGVEGNVAVPFRWGSYTAWRLYPNVKVSMDGRYETAYPEETFLKNHNFFRRIGKDWHRLVNEHETHFVMIDKTRLALVLNDLRAAGFKLVWNGESSALFARAPYAARLRVTAGKLPPQTADPLSKEKIESWEKKIP